MKEWLLNDSPVDQILLALAFAESFQLFVGKIASTMLATNPVNVIRTRSVKV